MSQMGFRYRYRKLLQQNLGQGTTSSYEGQHERENSDEEGSNGEYEDDIGLYDYYDSPAEMAGFLGPHKEDDDLDCDRTDCDLGNEVKVKDQCRGKVKEDVQKPLDQTAQQTSDNCYESQSQNDESYNVDQRNISGLLKTSSVDNIQSDERTENIQMSPNISAFNSNDALLCPQILIEEHISPTKAVRPNTLPCMVNRPAKDPKRRRVTTQFSGITPLEEIGISPDDDSQSSSEPRSRTNSKGFLGSFDSIPFAK